MCARVTLGAAADSGRARWYGSPARAPAYHPSAILSLTLWSHQKAMMSSRWLRRGDIWIRSGVPLRIFLFPVVSATVLGVFVFRFTPPCGFCEPVRPGPSLTL